MAIRKSPDLKNGTRFDRGSKGEFGRRKGRESGNPDKSNARKTGETWTREKTGRSHLEREKREKKGESGEPRSPKTSGEV